MSSPLCWAALFLLLIWTVMNHTREDSNKDTSQKKALKQTIMLQILSHISKNTAQNSQAPKRASPFHCLLLLLKEQLTQKKQTKKHCCSKSTLPFKSLRSVRFLFLTFFKKSRTKAALIWSQKYIEKYHYFKTNNFSKYILQWQADFFQQPLYYSFQCHMIFRNRSSLCKSLCRFIFLWKRFFYEQTLKEGLTLTFDQFNSSLLNTSIKEILRTTNYSFKYLSISNLFFACKVVRVENL